MRENFDYVTMDTYSSDMADHTRHAVGIIEVLKRRSEDAEKLIAQLVLAAGGKIKIHDQDLYSPSAIELTTYRNMADMSFILEAQRK